MEDYSLLIKPVITEKSMEDSEKGTYTFLVHLDSDKAGVKQLIKKRFGVDVISVKTSIIKGKTRRMGMKRRETKLSPIKKAMVTIKKGQKIDLFAIGA